MKNSLNFVWLHYLQHGIKYTIKARFADSKTLCYISNNLEEEIVLNDLNVSKYCEGTDVKVSCNSLCKFFNEQKSKKNSKLVYYFV